MIFMFDVDGTLTPSRGKIDPEFSDFFYDFSLRETVVLVTGSDKPKTIEQLGEDIFNNCLRVYNCSGNEVWRRNELLSKQDFKLPEEMHEWLSQELCESHFSLRTGLHFEHRNGMVNFSVVGRNATLGERKLYVEYDNIKGEREKIARKFNNLFGNSVVAKVGGETGIDIFPVGKDKSQVLEDFNRDDIVFFGDRCDPAGNDYPISSLLQEDKVHHVDTWIDTWEYLK